MCVGMYLRTTQRRNRDGSVVRYVQLAHNRRVDGRDPGRGAVEPGPRGPPRRGRAAPAGRLDQPLPRRARPPAMAWPSWPATARGRRVPARPGTAWLLDGLWRQLGVDRALAAVLGGRRFSTDVERVLFALVANRAIDPTSKLAAAEWATCDVAIAGLEAMDEDQAYRAMDLLVAADAQAAGARSGVLRRRRPVEPRGRPVVLRHHLHLLRTRHRRGRRRCLPPLRALQGPPPRPAPDRHRPRGDPGGDPGAGVVLARQHQRPDSILPEVKDGLRGWRLGRVVTVVDRGFSSDANLDYLRRAGGHWIAGERMRDGSPDAQAALSRQGRYQSRARQPAGQGSPPRPTPDAAVDRVPQPRRSRTRQGPTRRRARNGSRPSSTHRRGPRPRRDARRRPRPARARPIR